MKTYPEIARAFGLAIIKMQRDGGTDYLSGFIDGMKDRKASPFVVGIFMRIKELILEGCSDEEILEEINICSPEIIARNIIDEWSYPENIDLNRYLEFWRKVNEKNNLNMSDEEIMLYLLCNMTHALKIKMLD